MINMKTWNLDALYQDFKTPEFQNDLKKLDILIESFVLFGNQLGSKDPAQTLLEGISHIEQLELLLYKMYGYTSLRSATNVTDEDANTYSLLLHQKSVQTTLPFTQFDQYIFQLENLEEIIEQDTKLPLFKFFLLETKRTGIHLLSEKEEVLISKLSNSGSGLFGKMVSNLTSTLKVEYRGEIKNLPSIRNLAYDSDPQVRKDAYFAELESYKKIEKPVAFALNGIKNHAKTISTARGFSDVLTKTLNDSRMDNQTLDALLSAMKEFLPEFRTYLKQKATLLGHKNGLPFYDLFAPMGSCDKVYSIEEAQEFILKNFRTFSEDLYLLAKRAFDENWVDYTPRDGKRGGAFCSSIKTIKQSRILTNFTGSIGDVTTLAHELGHAYHNLHIVEEHILNSSYPMPIAETASILCETIVKHAALKESTSKEEKIGMLEQELQDSTQVIVDILSRFIFESNVIDRVDKEFLDENKLNKLMIAAQLETYGEGLDPNFLNSGMWINKSHYYSSGLNFYNFPYAFGLLFSKGIYAKYLEIGSDFVPQIQKLLQATGKMNLVDVAKLINIDITSIAFWRSSLNVIKKDIESFLELTK